MKMYVQIIILHVFLPCHDKLRVASYPLGSLTCKRYFNKTLNVLLYVFMFISVKEMSFENK